MKSNFLLQSHLVPEIISFRTSQLMSEMLYAQQHSLQGACEAGGKDGSSWNWHTSPGGSRWTMLVFLWIKELFGSMGLHGDGSDDGAEIKKLTENSQPCFTSYVTTNPVGLGCRALCHWWQRQTPISLFFHSHLPAEKSMKFWCQHTGEGIESHAEKEMQQGSIS